jgi:hypothetical protein
MSSVIVVAFTAGHGVDGYPGVYDLQFPGTRFAAIGIFWDASSEQHSHKH